MSGSNGSDHVDIMEEIRASFEENRSYGMAMVSRMARQNPEGLRHIASFLDDVISPVSLHSLSVDELRWVQSMACLGFAYLMNEIHVRGGGWELKGIER